LRNGVIRGCEFGFENTSVAAIAERAGLTERTLRFIAANAELQEPDLTERASLASPCANA